MIDVIRERESIEAGDREKTMLTRCECPSHQCDRLEVTWRLSCGLMQSLSKKEPFVVVDAGSDSSAEGREQQQLEETAAARLLRGRRAHVRVIGVHSALKRNPTT